MGQDGVVGVAHPELLEGKGVRAGDQPDDPAGDVGLEKACRRPDVGGEGTPSVRVASAGTMKR